METQGGPGILLAAIGDKGGEEKESTFNHKPAHELNMQPFTLGPVSGEDGIGGQNGRETSLEKIKLVDKTPLVVQSIISPDISNMDKNQCESSDAGSQLAVHRVVVTNKRNKTKSTVMRKSSNCPHDPEAICSSSIKDALSGTNGIDSSKTGAVDIDVKASSGENNCITIANSRSRSNVSYVINRLCTGVGESKSSELQHAGCLPIDRRRKKKERQDTHTQGTDSKSQFSKCKSDKSDDGKRVSDNSGCPDCKNENCTANPCQLVAALLTVPSHSVKSHNLSALSPSGQSLFLGLKRYLTVDMVRISSPEGQEPGGVVEGEQEECVGGKEEKAEAGSATIEEGKTHGKDSKPRPRSKRRKGKARSREESKTGVREMRVRAASCQGESSNEGSEEVTGLQQVEQEKGVEERGKTEEDKDEESVNGSEEHGKSGDGREEVIQERAIEVKGEEGGGEETNSQGVEKDGEKDDGKQEEKRHEGEKHGERKNTEDKNSLITTTKMAEEKAKEGAEDREGEKGEEQPFAKARIRKKRKRMNVPQEDGEKEKVEEIDRKGQPEEGHSNTTETKILESIVIKEVRILLSDVLGKRKDKNLSVKGSEERETPEHKERKDDLGEEGNGGEGIKLLVLETNDEKEKDETGGRGEKKVRKQAKMTLRNKAEEKDKNSLTTQTSAGKLIKQNALQQEQPQIIENLPAHCVISAEPKSPKLTLSVPEQPAAEKASLKQGLDLLSQAQNQARIPLKKRISLQAMAMESEQSLKSALLEVPSEKAMAQPEQNLDLDLNSREEIKVQPESKKKDGGKLEQESEKCVSKSNCKAAKPESVRKKAALMRTSRRNLKLRKQRSTANRKDRVQTSRNVQLLKVRRLKRESVTAGKTVEREAGDSEINEQSKDLDMAVMFSDGGAADGMENTSVDTEQEQGRGAETECRGTETECQGNETESVKEVREENGNQETVEEVDKKSTPVMDVCVDQRVSSPETQMEGPELVELIEEFPLDEITAAQYRPVQENEMVREREVEEEEERQTELQILSAFQDCLERDDDQNCNLRIRLKRKRGEEWEMERAEEEEMMAGTSPATEIQLLEPFQALLDLSILNFEMEREVRGELVLEQEVELEQAAKAQKDQGDGWAEEGELKTIETGDLGLDERTDVVGQGGEDLEGGSEVAGVSNEDIDWGVDGTQQAWGEGRNISEGSANGGELESDAVSIEGADETKMSDGEGKEMKPEESDRTYEREEDEGGNEEVESRPLMRKHFKVEVEDSDEEERGGISHADGGDRALPRIRLRRMAEGGWAVESEDRDWSDVERSFPRVESEHEGMGVAARRRHTSYIQECQFGGITKFHKPEEEECTSLRSHLRRKVKPKRRRSVPAGPPKMESFSLPLSLSPLSLHSPHHSSHEDPLSSEPQNWRRLRRKREMVEIRKVRKIRPKHGRALRRRRRRRREVRRSTGPSQSLLQINQGLSTVPTLEASNQAQVSERSIPNDTNSTSQSQAKAHSPLFSLIEGSLLNLESNSTNCCEDLLDFHTLNLEGYYHLPHQSNFPNALSAFCADQENHSDSFNSPFSQTPSETWHPDTPYLDTPSPGSNFSSGADLQSFPDFSCSKGVSLSLGEGHTSTKDTLSFNALGFTAVSEAGAQGTNLFPDKNQLSLHTKDDSKTQHSLTDRHQSSNKELFMFGSLSSPGCAAPPSSLAHNSQVNPLNYSFSSRGGSSQSACAKVQSDSQNRSIQPFHNISTATKQELFSTSHTTPSTFSLGAQSFPTKSFNSPAGSHSASFQQSHTIGHGETFCCTYDKNADLFESSSYLGKVQGGRQDQAFHSNHCKDAGALSNPSLPYKLSGPKPGYSDPGKNRLGYEAPNSSVACHQEGYPEYDFATGRGTVSYEASDYSNKPLSHSDRIHPIYYVTTSKDTVAFNKAPPDKSSPCCSLSDRNMSAFHKSYCPFSPVHQSYSIPHNKNSNQDKSENLTLSQNPHSSCTPSAHAPEQRPLSFSKSPAFTQCDPSSFVYSSSDAMDKQHSAPHLSSPQVACKPSDQQASASKSLPYSQASPYVFNFTGDHSVTLGYKDGGEYLNYSGAMPGSYTYRCLMEPSGTQGRLVLEPCGPIPSNCPPSAPLGGFAGLRGEEMQREEQSKNDLQQPGQGSTHPASSMSCSLPPSSHSLSSVHTDRKPKRLRLVVTDGSVDLDLQYTD
ncbi:hypothetical protein SKAU_G00286420 [Synaphobranchus kaupii]|uniref:Uncharacterized protein n=1 Tax=Synaphobranchus kaupii TaxID=118154 RepID=A0A9Q1EY46_SYNKA|nr:hypothetical protein SKAU_G00286420 [Synaphobranchus kaupii]